LNHLELLQALIFLKGPEGISLADIYQLIGKKDMEYALFLLSSLEEAFKNTSLKLKYIAHSKKYQIVIPNEIISSLEEKNILTPLLSKAARATLAIIIINTIKEEPITVSLLKKVRGPNVTKHLKELEDNMYISQENDHITITDKLISEVDLSSLVKDLETAEL
jgi:chromosome segregation and condensation protein ScpB